MTPARRSLLKGAASIGALSLAPWHSASAQTASNPPPARTFSPQPGPWRSFEVTTRMDIDRIGFFMYPTAENNEGRFDSYAPDDFKYQITAKEIKPA